MIDSGNSIATDANKLNDVIESLAKELNVK